MQLFTEYPEKNEREYCDRVVQIVKQQMEFLYGNAEPNSTKRDTHAKTHVCVRGTLEIFNFDEAALKAELTQKTALTAAQLEPISLKQGLLAKPQQYPVWIRFANGRGSVGNDFKPDTRSMSVKVIGIKGTRLKASHEVSSQDIITQNAAIFFAKTVKDYYGFLSAVMKSRKSSLYKLLPLFWLLIHPQQKAAVKTITSRVPKSLLTESYWSGSASALGLKPDFDAEQTGIKPVTYPAVVKYGFTPVSIQPPYNKLISESRSQNEIKQAKAQAKNGTSDNYYREQIISALSQPDAKYCWDFGIQLQTSPEMSIDDVTIPWSETESPFLTVGRLTVEHQTINFEFQCDFCENLRFSPWNGLAVHRPVGALNRLRTAVYPIVAEYRHQKRGVQYREPTGEEQF